MADGSKFEKHIADALTAIFAAEGLTTDDSIRRLMYGVRVELSRLGDRQLKQWDAPRRERAKP